MDVRVIDQVTGEKLFDLRTDIVPVRGDFLRHTRDGVTEVRYVVEDRTFRSEESGAVNEIRLLVRRTR